MRTSEHICPECKGNVKETTKEAYCIKCGYVVDSFPLDFGIDWTEYDLIERKKRRSGKPFSYLDGCGNCIPPTEIGFKTECQSK